MVSSQRTSKSISNTRRQKQTFTSFLKTVIVKIIGYSNERQILYTNIWTDENWLQLLPTENWLAFPIGQEKDVENYIKLAAKSIDNDVSYVCAVGEYCELIHDIFDEIIIEKELESLDNADAFDDSPMTTWHNNFSEGFWFAITNAHHELKIINKIICIDFTKQGVQVHLSNLVEKINNNWLPSDGRREKPIYDTSN
jgi:hypothetical protein